MEMKLKRRGSGPLVDLGSESAGENTLGDILQELLVAVHKYLS